MLVSYPDPIRHCITPGGEWGIEEERGKRRRGGGGGGGGGITVGCKEDVGMQ